MRPEQVALVRGAADSILHNCAKVRGDLSRDGWCDSGAKAKQLEALSVQMRQTFNVIKGTNVTDETLLAHRQRCADELHAVELGVAGAVREFIVLEALMKDRNLPDSVDALSAERLLEKRLYANEAVRSVEALRTPCIVPIASATAARLMRLATFLDLQIQAMLAAADAAAVATTAAARSRPAPPPPPPPTCRGDVMLFQSLPFWSRLSLWVPLMLSLRWHRWMRRVLFLCEFFATADVSLSFPCCERYCAAAGCGEWSLPLRVRAKRSGQMWTRSTFWPVAAGAAQRVEAR